MIQRFLITVQLVEVIVLAALSIPIGKWAGWPLWGSFAFVIAGFVVLRATFVAYSVVLAGFFDLKEQALEPRGSRLTTIWREITAYQFDYVFAQSFRRLPDHADGHGLPVVLVHGYICNGRVFNRLQGMLRSKLDNPIFAVTLEPVLGDIDTLAADLSRQVDSILVRTGGDRCVLVAHSMGGLVARAMIRMEGRDRIAGLVTIATPHTGTKLESHGPGQSARQMKPGSAWLADLPLPAPELPVLTIATGRDNVIVPRRSALLDNVERLVVPGVAHLSLLTSAATAAAIAEFVDRARVNPISSGQSA